MEVLRPFTCGDCGDCEAETAHVPAASPLLARS